MPGLRRFVLLVGATLLLAGCNVDPSDDPRTLPPLVRVAVATPLETATRAFTGVITARVQSNLGFRVGGKIVERLVDTGVAVKAGQPLMKIDKVDLDLTIQARKNAIQAAEAVAVQARLDEDRYKRLVKDGWTPRQKYEQAKSALDTAEAQLAAAKANAQIAVNEGDYSVLLADADGVVVETLAEPGQVVSAGQTVIRLARTGAREASVYLPENIRPPIGSRATATLYGHADRPTAAHLRQLSDAADPLTRTYEARYVLEGEAARAPLGATVTLRIPRENASNLVDVPVGAVFNSGSGAGVWLIEPGKGQVTFRPVKVQQLGAETAVISEGLKAGDEVVAIGAHLLHEAEVVRTAGGGIQAASR